MITVEYTKIAHFVNQFVVHQQNFDPQTTAPFGCWILVTYLSVSTVLFHCVQTTAKATKDPGTIRSGVEGHCLHTTPLCICTGRNAVPTSSPCLRYSHVPRNEVHAPPVS